MSHTDRARRPQVHGHRAQIRRVRMFLGRVGYQAVCSCGEVGEIEWTHAKAEQLKSEHLILARRYLVSAAAVDITEGLSE